jgi:2-hydroxy-3-oxopropionate reductase
MPMPPDASGRDTIVAVLGLGRMGRPIADNLVMAGFTVRGWNRSALPAGAMAPGVTVTTQASAAVDGADIVLLLLSDRDAIDELLFDHGLVRAIDRGAIVIDMGTSGPEAARSHSAQLQGHGIDYLDAPVSGGVRGAETGSLTILVGGALELFARAMPVLGALGTPHHLGPIGTGQTAKLANQIIVACSIAAVAEGMRFAQAQGLDGAMLVDALAGGFADSPILRQHGRRMAVGDYNPGGAARLHLKDLRLAAELDGAVFAGLTNTAEALARFERLVRDGHAEADHAAYYLTYDPEAAG